jgi:peroxidase
MVPYSLFFVFKLLRSASVYFCRVSSDRCLEFTRSSAACGSGSTSVFFDKVRTREQVNQLTSYIDASQVYGSESDLATSLRNLTNDYGRLREGPHLDYGKPLLPFNQGFPIDCRRDPRESGIGCFLAGDVRANEQVGADLNYDRDERYLIKIPSIF